MVGALPRKRTEVNALQLLKAQDSISVTSAGMVILRKDVQFAKQFSKRKASTDHWMSLSIGSSMCSVVISQVRKFNHLLVECYINDSKELYHQFYAHKQEIEEEMGMVLKWNELPDKKASRILAFVDADLDKKEEWQKQFDWVMDTAVKFKKVFKKYL